MEMIGAVNENLEPVVIGGIVGVIIGIVLILVGITATSGEAISAAVCLILFCGGGAMWANSILHDQYDAAAAQNTENLSAHYDVPVDPEAVEQAFRYPDDPEIHPFVVNDNGDVRDLGVRVVGGDLFLYDHINGDYQEMEPAK